MDFGYNFPSRTDRRSATGATPWSRPSCICKCVPCTPGVDSVIGWRDGEGMGGRWAWSSHSNPVSMVPLNQKCQLLPWVFPPFLAISDWLPAVANFILKQTTENARGRPILWWELLEGCQGCQGFGGWNPPLISNERRLLQLGMLISTISERSAAHQELRCRPQRRHWRSAGSAATGAVQEEWRKQLGQLGSRRVAGDWGPLGLGNPFWKTPIMDDHDVLKPSWWTGDWGW